MHFNKMIIFAGLSFVLIMAYSSYFLVQENNLVENNDAKLFAQQPEMFSKTEETIAGKVIKLHVENNVAKVIPQQPELFSKIEETIVTKANESQEESIKTIESSEATTNVDINNTNEKAKNEENKKKKLYQPIYDNGIIRSSAKAFFHLQDARSKVLEPNIVVKVRLWRNIRDDLWLEEEATYNHQKSMIECDGVNRQGLEPGYYSVEVDGGGYGLLKFKFGVKRNEEFVSTYIMPNFSKVIAVQFVDVEGNNVEYTRNKPSYKWNENIEPFSQYETKNYLVLRNSPGYDSTYGGGRKRVVLRGCGALGGDYVYQPENGRYYLRVFSGQDGQICYEYRKKEGSSEPFVFESKFDDKRQTIHIQLNERAIIKENTAIFEISNSNNNESNAHNVNSIVNESLKYEEEKLNYSLKGISFQLKNTKFPLQLEYKLGKYYPITLKGDGFLFQHNVYKYYTENEILIRFVDKKIFKTPWEKFSLEEGAITYQEKNYNLKEFKISLMLSPTFLEMSKEFSTVTSEDSSFDLKSTNKNLCFTSLFTSDDKLLEENLSKLNLSIKSNIVITDTEFGTFRPKGYIYGKDLYG